MTQRAGLIQGDGDDSKWRGGSSGGVDSRGRITQWGRGLFTLVAHSLLWVQSIHREICLHFVPHHKWWATRGVIRVLEDGPQPVVPA